MARQLDCDLWPRSPPAAAAPAGNLDVLYVREAPIAPPRVPEHAAVGPTRALLRWMETTP